MSETSRVTALVPTHNGSRYIADTLGSLAAQDHPALSIVVSDDASTDDTREVCDAFGADDRFRVIHQSRRLGWVGNSNALLARADGDFFFFAPHDDLFAPTYVSRLVEALDARPDAVLAFADTIAMGESISFAPLEVREGSRLRRALRFVPDVGFERALAFRGLVRTDALARAGLLRRSVVGEFDADGRWLFQLALVGPFVRVAEPLCTKRIHGESLARSWRYRRRTWAFDSLTYVTEAHRAGLSPLEVGVVAAAAVTQGLAHLLPIRARPVVSRVRRGWGI